MPLESIKSLVAADLASTDQYIIKTLDSNILMIKNILEYVLSCGGKRIRPMLLLLTARSLSHQAEQHIGLAAVIELIHTATLLHDDVVDGSTLRRGHETAHIIWGKNASILVGDFLYSRAFQLIALLKNQRILELFAEATHYISEGEILQLTNCHNADTTEAFYFEIIQRKTAKLFELAAEIGAIVATDHEEEILAFKNYGKHFGLAYQLIDDALDYSQSPEQTGKNIGQDISEGKSTLPLIQAMRKSKGADLKLIKDAIQEGSNKNLREIIGIIESTDSIKYTADAARYHAQLAKDSIANIASSRYHEALTTLSDFVVNRNY